MAMYKTKKEKRTRRHMRLRQKISGTADRPRLCVNLSNSNMYVQFVDDVAGRTLAAVSSLDKAFKDQNAKVNVKGAEMLGKMAGEKALASGIKEVVFDRGGFRFHGRVKALADAARSAGLKF